jgi:hypothetical protein
VIKNRQTITKSAQEYIYLGDTLITNYIDVFRRGEVKQLLDQFSEGYKKTIKKYLEKEFPYENWDSWDGYVDNIIKESLSRVLLRIQSYQHGGAVLIARDFVSDLEIKYNISYDRLSKSVESVAKLVIVNNSYSHQIHDNFVETGAKELPVRLYLDENVSAFKKDDAKNELKGAIRFASSLSCIDGLVLMDGSLNVKGFGTVIKSSILPKIVYTSNTAQINQAKLGQFSPDNFGTRHRSMFAYCWSHAGSLGFIISQDGDIRAVSRIKDKLIMWETIRTQQFIKSRKLKKRLQTNK